jgi:hypothetical protein
MDSIKIELYINNFGGTTLKRNYIWECANKKYLNTTVLEDSTLASHSGDPGSHIDPELSYSEQGISGFTQPIIKSF